MRRLAVLSVLVASVLGTSALASPPVKAPRKIAALPKMTARPRPKIVTLDRKAIRTVFPKQSSGEINRKLSGGRWKPSQQWLASEGKRYGRLLVVSDMHPSTGRDPVTRLVNPAEDFKNNEQEVDFANMMEYEWKLAETDGKVRTIVLNGDNFEFMQTERPAEGKSFKGSDEHGASNSPDNVAAKLEAIMKGHPKLFDTYAKHLAKGNRIVLIPGNHDRQLLHPTVRKQFVKLLSNEVRMALLKDPKFGAGLSKSAKKRAAAKQALDLVHQNMEFHGWFFMVGDFVARHGNETDAFNSFSSPLGDYYHPGAKDQPMEAAMGDYIVKAVFNRVERHHPWMDNISGYWEVAKAAWTAARGNPRTIFRVAKYLLTREGTNLGAKAQAKKGARVVADVTRYVREKGIVGKMNLLRSKDQQLTEAQVIEVLLDYEKGSAAPFLSHMDKNAGFGRRLIALVKRIPSIFRSKGTREIETEMTDKLFAQGVGTVAVGHDHTFRIEPRVVIEGDSVRKAEVIDTATWTDQVSGRERDLTFTPTARRGVLVVDFDAKGSHPRLTNYDPSRGLQMVNVLETESEAGEQ